MLPGESTRPLESIDSIGATMLPTATVKLALDIPLDGYTAGTDSWDSLPPLTCEPTDFGCPPFNADPGRIPGFYVP